MPTFGTSLPAVQQIPARAQAWEKDIGGPQLLEYLRAIAAAAAFRRAGATALHVGVGATSHDEYLARLEWLGCEVMPRVE